MNSTIIRSHNWRKEAPQLRYALHTPHTHSLTHSILEIVFFRAFSSCTNAFPWSNSHRSITVLTIKAGVAIWCNASPALCQVGSGVHRPNKAVPSPNRGRGKGTRVGGCVDRGSSNFLKIKFQTLSNSREIISLTCDIARSTRSHQATARAPLVLLH